MANIDALRAALEHYQQERQEVEKEFQIRLRSIDLMIWQLRRDLGEATEGEQPSLAGIPLVSATGASQSGTSVSVKPDEFFRMNQTDAARAYLKKVGHSIPFDELVVALRKGGAKLGGADPKKTLYVSLARNPRREFVWPSKDFVGLDEFYQDRTEK
jgi:hypothetical protein